MRVSEGKGHQKTFIRNHKTRRPVSFYTQTRPQWCCSRRLMARIGQERAGAVWRFVVPHFGGLVRAFLYSWRCQCTTIRCSIRSFNVNVPTAGRCGQVLRHEGSPRAGEAAARRGARARQKQAGRVNQLASLKRHIFGTGKTGHVPRRTAEASAAATPFSAAQPPLLDARRARRGRELGHPGPPPLAHGRA